MKTLHIVTLASLACIVSTNSLSAAPPARQGQPIPDQYVVVLRDGAARFADASVLDGPGVADVAAGLGLHLGAQVRRTFDHALPGFVARMSKAAAAEMARDPRVAFVEQDRWVGLAADQFDPPSWGLDRIDQRAGLDSRFATSSDGLGVEVFVMDTGIRSTHADFGGRVDTQTAFSAFADGNGTEDCHGHGTHVAGIIGGEAHGVAKRATLHPVRVLDCTGVGSASGVIAGIDWITSLKSKGKLARNPFVVNLSLGGFSWAMEEAISRATSAPNNGITFVIASGNDGVDPCAWPVYRVPSLIIVGASAQDDTVASYSNAGACVDLFAPGSGIVSTFNRSDDDFVALSGTSMATPHATGAAAIYLGENSQAVPSEVEAALLARSSAGVLPPRADGTGQRLLYAGFEEAPAPQDAIPVPSFSVTCRKVTSCTFDGRHSSDDQGIVSYSWDFGDGAVASGSRASHRFDRTGTFYVTLTVVDTIGQTGTLTRRIDL